jgi:hypothetical protein
MNPCRDQLLDHIEYGAYGPNKTEKLRLAHARR